MRTWELGLSIDRSSHRPLPRQLVLAIVEEIRSGRLEPGAPVPGTRTLARTLGVHRNTVVAAFEELLVQGWFETTRGSHTRVSTQLPVAVGQQRSSPRKRGIGFELRAWENSSRSFEAVPSSVLDFTGGLPDARLFPAQALSRAYRRSLRRSSGRLLDFGNPAGDLLLREGLAKMLAARRGLVVSADDVLVTRGSQLALHLLSLTLIRKGDVVAVESPGYPSAREAFTLMGAKLLPIRVDAEGLDVAALQRALSRRRIRALYLTPQHQDPTTVTLSARRRLALLELARAHRFAIIEADYDFEFQFEGTPVLPMASGDAHGVVVYVGTLSKALAPGLRMGFVIAPPPLRAALIAMRGQVDRQGDLGLEHAMAELLEDGEVLRHSLRARRIFQARRDLLVRLLRTQLGDALSFEVPRGGLALWARVNPAVDVERWAQASLEAGVRFFTGRNYDPQGQPLPFLRIGFSHLDEPELREAVRRMARARASLVHHK
jgi:GntR family transcriptional regulator/MocR family aminotransferase